MGLQDTRATKVAIELSIPVLYNNAGGPTRRANEILSTVDRTGTSRPMLAFRGSQALRRIQLVPTN